jgi:hypothetical protein
VTNKPEGRWVDEVHENYSEEELYGERLQDLEMIRESLYRFGSLEGRDLPELARHWLSELAGVGLREADPDRQAHSKQADPERPVIDAQEGELHPVRVGDHRQVFWLKVDGPRTGHGYKNIEVLDKPLRTQMAIVALLTILEANPMDVEKLRDALSDVEPPLESFVSERWAEAWWGLLGDEGFEWNEKIQVHQFRYVLALLRHYRPDFDELPHEEQVGLINGASERVNSFLSASRQLVEFLEYGSPGRDLREAAEGASRDVRAVVLKDVEESTLLQIAERFGLTITEKQRDERDHPRVRQMVKRGRRMLEGALGKDGWQGQIEAMKADAEWYGKLSTKEKAIQFMVDEGIPLEEARRHIGEVGRRSGGSIRRGMFLPGDPD